MPFSGEFQRREGHPKEKFRQQICSADSSIARPLIAALWRLIFTANMINKTLTAVLHKEDDLYVAECPEAGTVSQGSTIEDAIANLKEATELYLEEFPIQDFPKPFMTTFEASVNV